MKQEDVQHLIDYLIETVNLLNFPPNEYSHVPLYYEAIAASELLHASIELLKKEIKV